ncbi:MAG TPA: selenocysteine-specific translation elongation factor [Actinomycetota bacterium]
MTGELRVVATAGHVDHGKSSLIIRLTGIDPDRWEEEKRRGLTIDLGYAWCTLPSGREIGFVDVPGHERFVRNMLAGVGPVRLVLFVVAADEGWKPQSEEHLQILDVLGVSGGVVALTKRDLVDDETAEIAEEEVRERLGGTVLEDAPIVPVSSTTGEGLDHLRASLDAMLDAAARPPDERPRLFVDRVFTIKGAGTVVTGTLGGDCLTVGEEVELYPTGHRARIRSLQTHKKKEERACPVSRVAANLVGAERDELERGDVIGLPGAWRPTTVFEARLRPVRGLAHAITSRGAFKVYAGAAEADARLRLYGASRLENGEEAFARIRPSRPLVLDVGDRFVLREAGRRETVGGGIVLDVAPPGRPGPDAHLRLTARAESIREDLPGLLAAERGAVRVDEVSLLTGAGVGSTARVGEWLVRPEILGAVERAVRERLDGFHREHPLEEGAGLAVARDAASEALRGAGAPASRELIDALLASLEDAGVVARSASSIRLAAHRVRLDEHGDDVERLLAELGGEREAQPPTVKELRAAGFAKEVIDAAARAGVIVKVSDDLVFTPGLVARAEAIVRDAGTEGVTVSAFREALATSRKFALPLLEHFDRKGVTRREGDRRFAR